MEKRKKINYDSARKIGEQNRNIKSLVVRVRKEETNGVGLEKKKSVGKRKKLGFEEELVNKEENGEMRESDGSAGEREDSEEENAEEEGSDSENEEIITSRSTRKSKTKSLENMKLMVAEDAGGRRLGMKRPAATFIEKCENGNKNKQRKHSNGTGEGKGEGERTKSRVISGDENGFLELKMCHQCQRNDKGWVVRCTKCKTKRYCEQCIKT